MDPVISNAKGPFQTRMKGFLPLVGLILMLSYEELGQVAASLQNP